MTEPETPREIKVACPLCRMVNLVPADEVRIATVSLVDRIRFDCDDCGTVTKPVPFVTLLELLQAGMPPSITDEDVVEFQVGMTQIDDLAGVAELEGAA